MATRNRIRASLAPECVTDDVVVMSYGCFRCCSAFLVEVHFFVKKNGDEGHSNYTTGIFLSPLFSNPS